MSNSLAQVPSSSLGPLSRRSVLQMKEARGVSKYRDTANRLRLTVYWGWSHVQEPALLVASATAPAGYSQHA